MARPPPLVFLPDVPLREILAYLLLDTPRAPNRAAVVRTCKALHRLGLPLLYRVLDLGRYPTDVKFAGAWTVLFGAQGVLTQGGSMPNLAAMVVELRIGGCGRVDDWTGSDALQALESCAPVPLARCTSLTMDMYCLSFCQSSSFRLFLSRLPILDFSLSACGKEVIYTASWAKGFFGTTDQPWADLRTVSLSHGLFFDQHDNDDRKLTFPRLPFGDWSFDVLIVNARWPAVWPTFSVGKEDFLRFMFKSDGGRAWWPTLGRIELRAVSAVERAFRRRLKKATKAGSQAGPQKRILPLVVFVDEDGAERRLM